jgi:hypothetical protein
MPTTLHDDSTTQQWDRRPLTCPLARSSRPCGSKLRGPRSRLSVLSGEIVRSHKRAVCSLCVEMRMSAPCEAYSARMSMARSALTWSRAEVGSSARMSDGLLRMRRARAMRCCSPLSLHSSRSRARDLRHRAL